MRVLGWKADIYVYPELQESLLYSDDGIIREPRISGFLTRFKVIRFANRILRFGWWCSMFWRYRYHFYYGRPPAFKIFNNTFWIEKIFGKGFMLEAFIARMVGVRLIYLPSGCNDEESKENNTAMDDGRFCGNCGMWDRCHEEANMAAFAKINRNFSMSISHGFLASTQFPTTHMKYKAIDLDLWAPDIVIPAKHREESSETLRIMHSNYLAKSQRTFQGRNEKGSPYIVDAIERLKAEGHPVEYYFVDGVASREMRFHQAQADIIVDQLLYGWWGSTSVEALALGKPTVCYLRPSWKESFLKSFPEYEKLPIVEADIDNIYEVLKVLVTDEKYRLECAKASREFALQHFDPRRNAAALADTLQTL